MTVALTMTVEDAQGLWFNAAPNFIMDQPGRFMHEHPEAVLMGRDATLMWCDSWVAALLLRSWERTHGHTAVILWDDSGGDMDGPVVLTSRTYDEAIDNAM